MEHESAVITCPQCGTAINVSEILYRQVKHHLQEDFEHRGAVRDAEYQKKLEALGEEKAVLARERENARKEVEEAVGQKLKQERVKLETVLRKQLDDEKSGQLKVLEDELKRKSEEVRELNRLKAEMGRLEREKAEMKEKIEAETEQRFTDQLKQEREQIRTAEKEKMQTEIQKKEKLIDDLNRRLEEAQVKLEQGSNKLTGEVKEIELRDFLAASFPADEIKDVPSGVTGADVIHRVRNSAGQQSGTILYERKQTQKFDEKWIQKLKDDARSVGADSCILVTRAMPRDNEQTHFRDGVWVCTADDLQIVSALLRDGLLKQYTALVSQSDKGTKMEMLYNYLISNDFRNHVQNILEAFRSMDKSLEKERDDTLKRFAEREAHIFKAKQSILGFWGRVEGIAGDSLDQEFKKLEQSVKGGLP